jgi:hypothetical protein
MKTNSTGFGSRDKGRESLLLVPWLCGPRLVTQLRVLCCETGVRTAAGPRVRTQVPVSPRCTALPCEGPRHLHSPCRTAWGSAPTPLCGHHPPPWPPPSPTATTLPHGSPFIGERYDSVVLSNQGEGHNATEARPQALHPRDTRRRT